MANPNYRQQKRQKELARKTRQAEKLQKRQALVDEAAGTAEPAVTTPTTTVAPSDNG